MIKQIHTILAVTLICSFLFPNLVHAQDDKPLWWHNLDCDKEEKIFSGIEHCQGKDSDDYIHVIVIQLDAPGIQIEYLIPNGVNGKGIPGECEDVNRSTKLLGGPGCDDPDNRNWYPVMDLDQAIKKAQKQTNLAVVINGDYSACTISPKPIDCSLDKYGNPTYREHGPEGLTIVRNSRLDGPKNGDGDNNIVNRPYLVISQSTPIRAELHQSASDKDGSKPYSWAYTGIGGWPWLIQNGEMLEKVITSCENTSGSCRKGASQTAVGITLDSKWMFLVLAVDAPRLLDVADFMDKKLDVWQAMKFDGGGSSQLYYAGARNRNVETGDGRPLTNFLAIYAQPGTGIFSDSPSEPPDNPEPSPSDDLSWWQKIQKGWSDFWSGVGTWWQDRVNWWNGVKKDFTNWWNGVKTWWKELPNQIEELLKQLLLDWLNQWLNQLCGCGTTGLIPATLAVVVYSRRRRLIKK